MSRAKYGGKEYRGPEGRKPNAKDIAERLLPDLSMNELLLWSPDLFAYTSYIMNLTGTYQLVVSPPKGKNWLPTNEELLKWIGIEASAKSFNEKSTVNFQETIREWLKSFVRVSCDENNYNNLKQEEKEQWGLKDNLLAYVKNEIEFDTYIETIEYKQGSNTELQIYLDEKIDSICKYLADKMCRSLNYGKNTKPANIDDAIFLKYEDVPVKIDNDGHKAKDVMSDLERKSYRLKGNDEIIYLGELLFRETDKNWIQFVQGVGDSWDRKLSKLTDEEFYLINDAQLNERGNPIYDEAGIYQQWKDFLIKRDGKFKKFSDEPENKTREELLLGLILKYTPPLLIGCWAFFYNKMNEKIHGSGENKYELPISRLLCNRDDIQIKGKDCDDFWEISQALLTMHAISDICCTGWAIADDVDKRKNNAQWFAEKLLFEKGSLSTINTSRCRVMPKRHNPGIGITLRSVSSNLAFYHSSIEVVWRKIQNTQLQKQFKKLEEENIQKKHEDQDKSKIFLLLMPFPLDVTARDFKEEPSVKKHVNLYSQPISNEHQFFTFKPKSKTNLSKIIDLIQRANLEVSEGRVVDMLVFPESSISKDEFEELEKSLEFEFKAESPSLLISGVRESRNDIYLDLYADDETKSKFAKTKSDLEKAKTINEYSKSVSAKLLKFEHTSIFDEHKSEFEDFYEIVSTKLENEEKELEKLSENEVNFTRNAVYTKYYDMNQGSYSYKFEAGKPNNEDADKEKYPPTNQTPKHKQYKHHRWRLNKSQIVRYGLSQVLKENITWWESIKIPRRRVSFLNIGNKLTISTLVCEDLARQDPIADLIRHVGPSLVITLLMDGPQVYNRWSGRYASILSDDPGCSVLTLTSLGMVKRDISVGLSRVISLWSESNGERVQEINLAEGAEAVLLTLQIEGKKEKTADGREERHPTSILKLLDMIQIYPKK